MEAIRKQAQRFGAETMFKSVESVDLFKTPISKLLQTAMKYFAESLIVSTGASAKTVKTFPANRNLWAMEFPRVPRATGSFFQESNMLSLWAAAIRAMEEATRISQKHAARATVVHRRNELRASKAMIEKAKKNPKIDFRVGFGGRMKVLGTTRAA